MKVDVALVQGMAKDSRSHERHPIPARVDVFGAHVALNQPVADLSLGGCCVHGPSIEDCGAEVDLTFVFQGDSNPISLSGSVVRVDEDETGVKFIDLEDEQKWAIRKQIRAMAQALRRS